MPINEWIALWRWRYVRNLLLSLVGPEQLHHFRDGAHSACRAVFRFRSISRSSCDRSSPANRRTPWLSVRHRARRRCVGRETFRLWSFRKQHHLDSCTRSRWAGTRTSRSRHYRRHSGPNEHRRSCPDVRGVVGNLFHWPHAVETSAGSVTRRPAVLNVSDVLHGLA
jgi:hypothetical protein